MASYILRGIDPDLWKQVKSKAALEGITLKTLIERLFTIWLGCKSSEKGDRLDILG